MRKPHCFLNIIRKEKGNVEINKAKKRSLWQKSDCTLAASRREERPSQTVL